MAQMKMTDVSYCGVYRWVAANFCASSTLAELDLRGYLAHELVDWN